MSSKYEQLTKNCIWFISVFIFPFSFHLYEVDLQIYLPSKDSNTAADVSTTSNCAFLCLYLMSAPYNLPSSVAPGLDTLASNLCSALTPCKGQVTLRKPSWFLLLPSSVTTTLFRLELIKLISIACSLYSRRCDHITTILPPLTPCRIQNLLFVFND